MAKGNKSKSKGYSDLNKTDLANAAYQCLRRTLKLKLPDEYVGRLLPAMKDNFSRKDLKTLASFTRNAAIAKTGNPQDFKWSSFKVS